jgi:hypothetical protein
MNAAAPIAQVVPFPANNAAQPALQAAAALARTLAESLLANVQNTTALNVAAARALLQHARIKPPAGFGPRTEQWRWAWRSFEICATSADQILGLARGHVERSTSALWGSAQRLLDDLEAQGAAQAADLRRAFESLQAAQSAYWQAAQEAHGALLLSVQTPAAGSASHATH